MLRFVLFFLLGCFGQKAVCTPSTMSSHLATPRDPWSHYVPLKHIANILHFIIINLCMFYYINIDNNNNNHGENMNDVLSWFSNFRLATIEKSAINHLARCVSTFQSIIFKLLLLLSSWYLRKQFDNINTINGKRWLETSVRLSIERHRHWHRGEK